MSDLDLDAIRARTDAVHRENQLAGPDHAITALVCDAWALVAEVERLKAEHPCKPMIVISEVFGGGLEVRCGNCGTANPIGDGGEMSLADLAGYLEAHCEASDE